ncbi:putative dehydrogenase [Labedella gwakjiensis]|uniref:Gfo/Idh/MocA family oxidoreductase n=1 Tax=Labedella gwakjiensis TaxID=390269 RepID=A0A2P8GUR0_9MICO|nr:Gfo/Idh/MocA family oxidoreductase [Labedella gwakjiensis]PSL37708.1 putative dehydrogenase [Labedella gwakjiensis]RUQ87699.1 Gfo/Idh/MocA family oxidoreductase [Labedella gwakjiensis]
MSGLTIAVVGLGFGQDFVPIYLSHPAVATVVLVEPDAQRRAEVAGRFGLRGGFADIADALADPAIDAVHILAPVFLHADMAVAALEAGKHVACAVPMATTLDDLERIIAAKNAAGTTYMMMETAVFGREYLVVEEMLRRGEFGAPTLFRGFHIQNLDGYPVYWQGFPPMHYLTHALSPVLGLLDTTVESVTCLGTGRLPESRRTGGFDNPFPTEVGLFTLRDQDIVADITMSFFQTARAYVEGFALYGEHLGVEWPPDNEGDMTVYRMSGPRPGSRGNQVVKESLAPRDFPERLPEPLRRFVRETDVHLPGMPAPASVGAHHGGSHPFLVHEFVSSIVDGRAPIVDERRAADFTAPGICAHRSALAGGERVEVPQYS